MRMSSWTLCRTAQGADRVVGYGAGRAASYLFSGDVLFSARVDQHAEIAAYFDRHGVDREVPVGQVGQQVVSPESAPRPA
jgi:hypothetical protein